MPSCARHSLTELVDNVIMKNKERVTDWLDDIKNEVDRIGAYDLDDHIQVLTQMIEALQKFVKEDC